MRRCTALLLCLAWVTPTHAQKVVLPVEVRGDPGAFIAIPADTDGSHVRWLALDGGLNVFPSALLKDSRTAVVTAGQRGRYRLAAYTAKGDVPSEPAICVVIVGDAPPPGPTPPVPPGPTPPVDPLAEALQAAYRQEDAGTRGQLKTSMAALYRQSAPMAMDARVETFGQLFAAMKTAAGSLGLAGRLPKVQAVIAAHLSAALPTDPAAQLSGKRDTTAAAFLRVATALDSVKE